MIDLNWLLLALGEDMYDDGYKNITNIDYSCTVIKQMAERCSDRPEMKCRYQNETAQAKPSLVDMSLSQ